MDTHPTRLGIILVGNQLRQSTALKLLILAMNDVQKHFEYEFLPDQISDARAGFSFWRMTRGLASSGIILHQSMLSVPA
jgi:hypothetical protein